MPWTTHLLVVANRTAESNELVSYLHGRATSGPTRVTLAVPVESGGRPAAQARLERALARFAQAGVPSEGLVVGDTDPLHAVLDVFQPAQHDEIVVSTLPAGVSRWLRCDLPQRIARVTGALVRHVVAQPPPPSRRRAPAGSGDRRPTAAAGRARSSAG